MTTTIARRDDVFVSIGVTGSLDRPEHPAALLDLTRRIDRHFRFWELLLVSEADAKDTHQFAIASLPHLRLLKVRAGTSVYHQRMCIAREAIGNIVLMSCVDEIDQVTVPDLIDMAERTLSIVVLRRRETTLFNPALVAFGRSAGFRVDLRDTLTTVYPRALLDRVMQHPDVPLALRFPPVDTNLPLTIVPCEATRVLTGSAIARSGYRLNILRQLLVSSAPRVLSIIELISVLVTIAAMMFAIYAVIVWLTFDTVQPGWFSMSLLLSMVAMFLSASIFALAMGLERLLVLVRDDFSDELLEEVNSIDVFKPVMRELNIDLGASLAEARAASAARG